MIRLAVSSLDETIRQGVAPRLRGATIETGLDSLLHAPPEACDAVAFLGSSRPEPEAIERWLHAGKHVLLAAEACLSMDVLEGLFDAARRHNVRLGVVNPDRYLPSRQLIRQQLEAGKLGNAVLVRLHRWEPVASDSSRLPGPMVRDLEMTLAILGKPPQLVYAIDRAVSQRAASSSRFVQVHLGFPGGGMALLDHTDGLPSGDAYQSLSVIGSAGAAYADDHQNMQLLYRGGRPWALRTNEEARQMAALVQEFVDALNEGRDTPGEVISWRTVWAVADAARRSLETGQALSLGGS